jgi:predicted O-methyltransferase YrrM
MAQQSRTADNLDEPERRVMKEISAFASDRRGFDMSVPRADGELLQRLVEETKVRNAVEIGTSAAITGCGSVSACCGPEGGLSMSI